MSGGDGFLSRWSRRKLEVEREQSPAAAPPEPAALAAEPSPAEVVLSEEELALLPRIEDLGPDSDITAFLRNGVPEMLKNAALRRIWSLDPAVRDYVGDARDYAWNWNLPGDVPGNGPLIPSDDMAARIERMFSDTAGEDGDAVAVQEAATGEVAGPGRAVELSPGEIDDLAPEPSEPGAAELLPVPEDEERPDLAGALPASARTTAAPLRRHGTAIPKLDRF